MDLAPGHANRLSVAARIAGARARLALPGRPAVVLELARSGATLTGSARQGATVGRVRLRRGAAQLGAYGSYRLGPEQTLGVVPLGGNPFGVVYETGEIRRLHPTGAGRFELSAGLGTRAPVAGVATFGQTGASWRGTPATRVASRALEVRFPSGGDEPRGHADAASGSRPASRRRGRARSGADPAKRTGVFAPYFASRGIAVLATTSEGRLVRRSLPRRAAAGATEIDSYARDAGAAARFLRSSPRSIGAARPRRASARPAGSCRSRPSREPAIRFLVLAGAPTVTQGESDRWGRFPRTATRPATWTAAEQAVRADGPSGVDPIPRSAS